MLEKNKINNFKQIIKKIACSPILFPYIRKVQGNSAIIIMYHNVHNTDTNCVNVSIHVREFEKQIKFFQKYFKIISLGELVKKIKERKTIRRNTMVLTFDDGYRNNFTLVYPLLVKYKLHATIFLVADFINTNKWLWVNKLDYLFKNTLSKKLLLKHPKIGSHVFYFDSIESRIKVYEKVKKILKHIEPELLDFLLHQIEEQLGSKTIKKNCQNYMMLQKDDIKAMDPKYVEFGSHGCTHYLLTTIKDKKKLENEIINSKKKIAQIVGYEPRFFCYPNGEYDYEVIKLVKKHYTAAVTTNYGSVNRKVDLFTMPRVGIIDDVFQFKWEILRA